MDYMSITLVIAAITLLIGVIVAVYVWKSRKKGKARETDYRALFIIGICFLPLGTLAVSTENPGMLGLSALGIIYMAIGLAHRDKWKK